MDRSPQARAHLRFEVAGVEGPVDQALLAVFVKPDSSWTPLQVRSFPAEGWTETRLTYANAPDDGPLVDQVRVSGEGQWVLFDVTAEVRGNGSVGFTLASSSANSRWATSRETGRPPILAVSTDGRMLPEPPRGAMTHPLWTTTSVEEFDRELDLLAQAGADVVRLDIGWGALERDGPGDFQEWYVNRADTFIEHARARGLGVIATFWGVPCWASAAPSSVKQGCDGEWWRRGVDRYAPEDPDRFARAAAWVAERWGDELTALEVWNEPNIPYFLEGEQDRARTYSRILKPAYPRIKATKRA
jgi:Cellulase (glycosyl hydrolase family 5)